MGKVPTPVRYSLFIDHDVTAPEDVWEALSKIPGTVGFWYDEDWEDD